MTVVERLTAAPPVDAEEEGRILASARALEDVMEEARARYPEECCGALLGREAADGTRVVVRAVAVGNERSSERNRRYLLGPEQVRAVEEEADEAGLELLGFFHSHPDVAAVPSDFDREHAWPWYSYLIVPVRDGDPGRPRAWRLTPDRTSFVEDEVVARSGEAMLKERS